VNVILKEKNITVFAAVSGYFGALVNTRIRFINTYHEYLRMIIIGGGQPHINVIKELYKKVKNNEIDVVLLYGLTETSWTCSISIEEYLDHIGSIGKPLPGIKLFIKNNKGISRNNRKGILVQSGGIIFSGYYRNKEKTEKTIIPETEFCKLTGYSDRAIITGDIVKRDKDNYYIYVGRKDDQIKINGFCITIQELESIFKNIKNILNVTVVEFELEINNFEYYLFIQIEDNDTKNQILKDIRNGTNKNIYPQKIFFINDLPYSATGKVDRDILIKKYIIN
jgi:acyl-coenzyme A synthetase/AMP-(fatty) acid ligase